MLLVPTQKLELQAVRCFQHSNYKAVRIIEQPLDLMELKNNPISNATSHVNQTWYYRIVNINDHQIMHDHLTKAQLIETINRLFH